MKELFKTGGEMPDTNYVFMVCSFVCLCLSLFFLLSLSTHLYIQSTDSTAEIFEPVMVSCQHFQGYG